MGAIKGNKIVYLNRLLADAKTMAAMALAFQTENGRTKSRDSDTVVTKDGPIRVPGDIETEISATALFADENDEMIAKLEQAIDTGERVEIWEVNLAKKGTSENASKYKGKYFQGYVTSLELSSNAEDHAEVSIDFAIEGEGKDGYVTVSAEQEKVASYVFKDTTQETE